MKLTEISTGEWARIQTVGSQGALRRRLLDMGITPGARVMVRKVAPFGDPLELSLRGYELTIRREEAQAIEISLDVAEV